MSKVKSLLFIYGLSLLIAAGCSRNRHSVVDHDEAFTKSSDAKSSEGQPSQTNVTSRQIQQMTLLLNQSKQNDLLESLHQAMQLVFSNEFLENKDLRLSQQGKLLLEQFNFSLRSVPEHMKNHPAFVALVRNYKNRLLENCNIRELKGCAFLSAFKQDSQTSLLILDWAKDPSLALEKRMQWLKVSVEMQPLRPSPEVAQIFAKEGITVLVDIYRNDGNQKLGSDLVELIYNILHLDSGQAILTGANDSVKQYLFYLSQEPNISALLPLEIKQQFQIAFLQSATSSRENFDYLKQIIANDSPKNIQNSNSDLSQQLGGPLASHYGVELASIDSWKAEDLIAWHVVSNYLKTANLKFSLDLIEGLHLDPVHVAYIMKQKIAIDLSLLANQSHKTIASTLKELESIVTPSEYPLKAADKIKNAIGGRWTLFRDQIAHARKLFSILESFVEDDSKKQMIKKYHNYAIHFSRTVIYSVTYPHLFMIGYYSKKLNFSFKFKTLGSDFRISTLTYTANKFITSLFHGEIPDLLEFGGSYEKWFSESGLSDIEISQAFYHFVNLNISQYYGISLSDWYEIIASGYLEEPLHLLETIKKTVTDVRGPMQTVQKCNLFLQPEVNGLARWDRKMDPNGVVSFAYFGLPVATKVDSDFKPMIKSYFSKYTDERDSRGGTSALSTFELLESIRSDIDPRLRNIKLLSEITRLQKEASGIDFSDLQNAINKRQDIFSTVEEALKTGANCAITSFAKERERILKMFNMHVVFFKEVYAALRFLNNVSDKNMTFSQLIETTSTSTLWTSPFWRGLKNSRELFDKPLIEAFNLYLAKQFSAQTQAIKEVANYHRYYVQEYGFKVNPDNSVYFNSRRLEAMLRTMSFLKDGFLDESFEPRNDNISFSFPNDYEGLVKHVTMHSNTELIVLEKQLSAETSILIAEDEAEDLFVKNALMKLMDEHLVSSYGTLFYNNQSISYSFHKLILNYMSFLRIAFSDELNKDEFCSSDACQKKTYNHMLKESFYFHGLMNKLAHIFNISEEEEKFFSRYTNKVGFHRPDASYFHPIQLFTLRTKALYLGFSDLGLEYLSAIHLGQTPKYRHITPFTLEAGKSVKEDDKDALNSLIIRNNPYEQALTSGRIYHRIDEFWQLPIPDDIRDFMITLNKKRLVTELMLIDAFVKSGRAAEVILETPSPIRYALDGDIGPQQPSFISDSVSDQFQQQMYGKDGFHNNSYYYFEVPQSIKNLTVDDVVPILKETLNE